MSDEPPFSSDDDTFERELKRLQPSQLKVDFVGELARDHQRIASRKKVTSLSRLKRFGPVAACLILLGAGSLWLNRDIFFPGQSTGPIANQETPASAPVSPDISEMENSGDRFVPVSSRGYLLNASSGGVIDSPNGPREQFQLDFGDVHHWHDPDTSTNIRIFSPRQETVVIPLQTD